MHCLHFFRRAKTLHFSHTFPPHLSHRAVAWYLHAGKERSELDAGQWKAHSEAVEGELAEGKLAWSTKEAGFQQQIQGINVRDLYFCLTGTLTPSSPA